MSKNQTTTAAFDVDDLLERVTDDGEFSAWVKVTRNQFGGVDIANTRSGETFRIAIDDNVVNLHVYRWGPSMLLAGTQTFAGFLADPAFVAPALIALL